MNTKCLLPKFSLVLLSLALLTSATVGCGDMPLPTLPYPSAITPPPQGATTLPDLTDTTPSTARYPAPPSTLIAAPLLSFQSVIKGYLLGASSSDPELIMVLDEQSLASLEPMVDRGDFSMLSEIDLEEMALLAIFWGQQPSGGHSITVQRIYLAGDELVVEALLQENDPEFPKIEAITSPYHLVTVAKDQISGKVTRYRLVSGDQVLASGVIP